MDQFCLYGAHKSITLAELLEQQRNHQMLFARAEQSGCEGTYVEVAIWNENHRQWQRYAFLKCFGGEHPELPDAGSIQTARQFADDVNRIVHIQDVSFSIVHNMPPYTTDPACVGNTITCDECGASVGCSHNPACGKRVVGCPIVVPDDCDADSL